MIRLSATVDAFGRHWIEQQLDSPSVYLDTWALRLFSENADIAERLRRALFLRGGTLAISEMSHIDFAYLTDDRHAQLVAGFVDSLTPNVFFTRGDPFFVIAREQEFARTGNRYCPAGDEGQLNLFGVDMFRAEQMTIRPWFRAVHARRDRVRAGADSMVTAFSKGVNELRAQVEANPAQHSAIVDRNIREAAQLPKATLALIRALIDYIQANRTMPLNRNNLIDFMQVIVPSAYCDFVLLDTQWELAVQSADRRIAEAGVVARIANAYSQRDNGVTRFLEALERLDHPN